MRALIFLLSLLVVVTGARAEPCQPASPEVDTGETPAGRYYVDNDPCQQECLFSIWIYQESNGQDGLQRGDEFCDDAQPCCDPDTILF